MPEDRRAPRDDRRARALAKRSAHGRKAPLSADRIVATALEVVAAEGFEALTMRRVAAALGTGPASLYAHVVDKADLDELLIGHVAAQVVLPEPDGARWKEQIFAVAVQIRDQYLRYPGLSQAALGVVPSNPDTLRISEGMLGILLAGEVEPQTAAWAVDALSLYVNAYCLELGLWIRRMNQHGGWEATHDDLMGRFEALSEAEYPLTKRYAAQLTAGEEHDRFDFALRTMIDGLGGR